MSTVETAPTAFSLRDVRQSYSYSLGFKRREVLRGIDLELARGKCLGLAGPNGSGKSTLLHLLAGVERAKSGQVRVLDGSPEDARVRQRIGYLPEDSPFPPELDARSALLLLGSLQGMRRAECRALGERLLAEVGLTEHAGQRLSRYSRGMLRRFGLAQAWLNSPELILLDEPTAGLDAQGFEVLELLIGRARSQGSSLVIASHQPADMDAHCDELAVILAGRIAAKAPPRELLAGRSMLALYRGLGSGASDDQDSVGRG